MEKIIQTIIKYFKYRRKSSEDEDRQKPSLEDQDTELQKLQDNSKIETWQIVDNLAEAKSAKEVGRSEFNKMMERIKKGEGNGILVWHPDRLSRNPIDTATLVDLMDREKLFEIKTPQHTFRNAPMDKFMFALLCLQAKLENDNKGVNVKRGLASKIRKGWRPGPAPLGYLNDTTKPRGERDVFPDPERFNLVKRVLKTFLSGKYSVEEIWEMANKKWKLRTRITKRQGGKPLSLSHYYKILAEPSYYGKYLWNDPETGGKKLFDWNEKLPRMITEEEFNRIQVLLGKPSPRPKNHPWPYTLLAYCGECGSMITMEEKFQLICSNCKFKFAYLNKNCCPKCGIKIEAMKNPKRLHYVYLHCTKKKNPNCTQKSITIEEWEKQADEALKRIQISENFKDWAIKTLQKETEQELKIQKQIDQSTAKERSKLKEEFAELNRFIIKQENVGWPLMKKEDALAERERIEKALNETEVKQQDNNQRAKNWFDLSVKTFEFACFARFWFQNGTVEQKRAILSALGSNLTLKDKKLSISIRKPLNFIEEMVQAVPEVSLRFEPAKFEIKTLLSRAQISTLLRG